MNHARIPVRPARVAVLAVAVLVSACSPVYVIRAAVAEVGILGSRRPIPEVVLDSTVDAATRGTLTLVAEAREFARDSLGLDVGGSYTSYTELESDTLALVLSAAYRDRLVPKTWWFPVVGHVPYRGFFDEDKARKEQDGLEARGLDTYLRPTAAFSTLGWFDDPLLSSVVSAGRMEAVTTVLHELSHNHLFVPGRVGFNESYATFVGRAGAAEFFCRRDGGGPDTAWCTRARARWRDVQRFSVFIGEVVAELEAVYGDPALDAEAKIRTREEIFRSALSRFESEVSPTFESLSFAGFARTPLNNATLLSRVRYYRRLPDFDALARRCGGVEAAVAFLRQRAGSVPDPFALLDESAGPCTPATGPAGP